MELKVCASSNAERISLDFAQTTCLSGFHNVCLKKQNPYGTHDTARVFEAFSLG